MSDDLYKNKYRIKSHRLQGWNYAGNGYYFITLVTQHRVCNLGKIKNNKIMLSGFGKIVETEWYKSFEIRRELFLDEFIIMPNHLHAIIILNKKNDIVSHDSHVETHGRASLQYHQYHRPEFYRKPKSISSFIAGYKSAINTKIDDYIDLHNLNILKYNRKNHFFQPNYYDHIIRNNDEYWRIKNYIINNLKNWNDDTFFNK